MNYKSSIQNLVSLFGDTLKARMDCLTLRERKITEMKIAGAESFDIGLELDVTGAYVDLIFRRAVYKMVTRYP